MYSYHEKQYHRLCICLLSVIFSISCPVYAADTPPSSDTLSAHNALLLDTAQSLSTMTDRTEEMKNLLIDAQIQEARQYQMMRLRIQWLYENRLFFLLGAASWSSCLAPLIFQIF